MPLFLDTLSMMYDDDGWVKTRSGTTKAVPDARNRHVYKCVQSKPTTGEAYPSMWVDEDFVRANDFNNQYYHGIATAYKKDKSKPQEDDAMIADGIYKANSTLETTVSSSTGTRGTPCATKNSDC